MDARSSFVANLVGQRAQTKAIVAGHLFDAIEEREALRVLASSKDAALQGAISRIQVLEAELLQARSVSSAPIVVSSNSGAIVKPSYQKQGLTPETAQQVSLRRIAMEFMKPLSMAGRNVSCRGHVVYENGEIIFDAAYVVAQGERHAA